ncbi:MAG: N-acetylglucosamine-6-phosphate deacetylase [Candidatus Endonucleobacter bathymodioli]|uniref:N-acetylglucosamine-6-phosphate deacetylase n=1 Tax=Candidatus Endonucleibacter bathymodioli TaxID=539814 RepID=A0AA90NV77_9GAMM|nr:N-acetylglucosamine-6-phosphate deacetylase [Candidatus Endonucleobacter bathymodioli]
MALTLTRVPDMADFYLKAKEIFTEDKIIHNAFMGISNGLIVSIGDRPGRNDNVVDLGDGKIVPGFIDIHIHGSGGFDVMDASYEALNTISTAIAANGVTGFLGTTVTSSWDATICALKNIHECFSIGLKGAELLGAYSEGLFFSDQFKGAHASEYFLAPTQDRLDAMLGATGGKLKVLAIAPELEGAIDAIRYLTKKGIKVMVGHTGATYQQSKAAFDAGAVGGVHIFNQMLALHHRQPGTVGAILHNRDTFAELIADGVHVDPVIMDLVYRLKGVDKTALITDCICAAGLGDGVYKLGLLAVTVTNGVARTHTGALAGSTLVLNKAVANMIKLVGACELDAVHMASLTPATLLGLDKETGSIKENKRANLAVLNDNYDVSMTFVDGNVVYQH